MKLIIILLMLSSCSFIPTKIGINDREYTKAKPGQTFYRYIGDSLYLMKRTDWGFHKVENYHQPLQKKPWQ